MKYKDKIDLYSRIEEFINQSPWKVIMDQQFHRILRVFSEETGIDSSDVLYLINEDEYFEQIVLNSYFENFISQKLYESRLSVIDDYLDRFGESESAESKEYLEALGESSFVLFQVLQNDGNEILAEMLEDELSITFKCENEIYKEVSEDDIIGVRLINIKGTYSPAFAVLPFHTAGQLEEMIEVLMDEFIGVEHHYLGSENEGVNTLFESELDFSRGGIAILQWLTRELRFESPENENIINRLFEEIESGEIIGLQYRIQKNKRENVLDRLLDEFEQLGPDHFLFELEEIQVGFVSVKARLVEFGVVDEKFVEPAILFVKNNFAGLLNEKPIKTYQSNKVLLEKAASQLFEFLLDD